MSRPRFLADEDLSGIVIGAVRRMTPGVAIVTIVEENLEASSDEEILEFAWQNSLLVISHDVSTMAPSAEKRIADGRGIHGLFLAPQSRSVRLVAESLVLVSEASEFEEWRDRIVYLPF